MILEHQTKPGYATIGDALSKSNRDPKNDYLLNKHNIPKIFKIKINQ